MAELHSLGRPILNERAVGRLSELSSSHRFIWLIILMCTVFGVAAAAGPKISKVRAGDHESFARLVFEFEGKALVGDPQESPGKIRLSFPDTTTDLQSMQFENGTMRSIEFVREGRTLDARIEVTVDRFEHRLFALTEPDRIVLDVYPKQPAALAVAEKEEVGPTEETRAPRTESSGVNSQVVGPGASPEAEHESLSEVTSIDSAVPRMGPSTSKSHEDGPVVVESEMDASAGLNWTPVGLVALGLFLIGLLSIACAKVLKETDVNTSKSRPNEEFRENVAAIDTLIKKEIRNFDRLRWRKQE